MANRTVRFYKSIYVDMDIMITDLQHLYLIAYL